MVTSGPAKSVTYDVLGNLTMKSDVSNYTYPANTGTNGRSRKIGVRVKSKLPRPHAAHIFG